MGTGDEASSSVSLHFCKTLVQATPPKDSQIFTERPITMYMYWLCDPVTL